jgi:hypothetical protein
MTNTRTMVNQMVGNVYVVCIEGKNAKRVRVMSRKPNTPVTPIDLVSGKQFVPGFLLSAENSATILSRMCDHDWIDDSHAGPDSGNIDMTCRKCGKTCYASLY